VQRKITVSNREDLQKFDLKIDSSIEYVPGKLETKLKFFLILTYPSTEYMLGAIKIKGDAQVSDSLTIQADEKTNFNTLINEVSRKARSELEKIKSEITDILVRGAPQVTVTLEDMLDRIMTMAKL
jgi:hypothetical protein